MSDFRITDSVEGGRDHLAAYSPLSTGTRLWVKTWW